MSVRCSYPPHETIYIAIEEVNFHSKAGITTPLEAEILHDVSQQ